MTAKKVVAVGFSCVDVYEKLGLYYPTGNGIDWGIHLSRSGVPVSVVSVVGTDQYGELMREALRKENIDISHLKIVEGDTCIMLMDLKNGTDRVHLEEISGVMAEYSLDQEDVAFIKKHDLLHTDLFGNVLGWLGEFHQSGVKVVLDFSVFIEDPEYACQKLFINVNYVFFSNDEADEDYLKGLLQDIKAQGPELVTVTRGEKGSICFDGEKFYSYGIFPVQPLNTVGAGDAYIAGFTYGILNNWDINKCMEHGAQLSANVITKFEPY